ncbi:MAG: type II secretion system protein [Verrucomicrobiales bacterium]
MKLKHAKPHGFTLIELLVVMTIIAVLATVGFSAFGKARETANRTAATSNMKQIHLAMSGYASDNNDAFPDKKGAAASDVAATTANQAFRKLIPGYLTDERTFQVKGSPSSRHNDGNTDQESDRLAAGENHYAVGADMTATSNGNYPLIWETGTSGDETYAPSWTKGNRDVWGGSWSDGSVLIITVSGGVQQKKLDLPSSANEGESATIVKDGQRTIFEQRKNANSNARGLGPERKE